MKTTTAYLTIILAVLLLVGCSSQTGSGSLNPMDPSPDSNQALTSGTTDEENDNTQTCLWGYFDIYLDPESHEIEITPNRSMEYSTNVVMFLNSNPLGISVVINGGASGTDYVTINLDVSITHPLSLEKFNGYDVRGIFIGEGSIVSQYNTSLVFPAHGTDQVLLNADGYSRWWNPTEFMMEGFMGYTHGNLASAGYQGTGTLNGYKYFGEGLGANDNLFDYLNLGAPDTGYFLADTTNTRKYVIRFQIPAPGIKYGYAVVANWGGGAPADHPSHATEAVGVSVNDTSTLYYVDGLNNGGHLILDISVFDWGSSLTGGVMEDYTIFIGSNVLSSSYEFSTLDMTPVSSSGNTHIYHVEIPADNVTGLTGNGMMIFVHYNDADYASPFGIPNAAQSDNLAAAFRYPLDVSDTEPLNPTITVIAPNGGETWTVGTAHDITWISEDVTGNVSIQYSNDSFNIDIHDLGTTDVTDGIFAWNPIAKGSESDNVLVRVSSTDDPSVNDVSDNFFTIAGYGWARTWPDDDLLGNHYGCVVGSDNQDFIYASGSFYTATNAGMFLRKYNLYGDLFWEKTFPHVDTTGFMPTSLHVDNSSNILISGGYRGTIDLDPGNPGGEHTSIGGLSYNGFIVTYDQYGNYLDSLVWDATHYINTVMTQFGDVYCFGSFYGNNKDFDPDPVDDFLMSADGDDAFLMHLTSTLDFDWAIKWGGLLDDRGLGCAIDPMFGDVFVCGGFDSINADFDPGAGTDFFSTIGNLDCFLIKFEADGTYVQAVTWGGPEYDRAHAIGIQFDGTLFVGGDFQDTVDFDPDPVGEDSRTAISADDIFIIKSDGNLNYSSVGAYGSDGNDSLCGLVVDMIGMVFSLGFSDGSNLDLDPSAGVDLRNPTGASMHLIAVDNSISYLWGNHIEGVSDDEAYTGIGIFRPDNILITGTAETPTDLSPNWPGCSDAPYPHDPGLSYDAFIIKYLSNGCWME